MDPNQPHYLVEEGLSVVGGFGGVVLVRAATGAGETLIQAL